MPPIRVLPVDDSVVMRRAITEMLAGVPDIEAQRPAQNGVIALQRIRECPPDVVILDVEMPEMSGLATLAEIRKLHPKMPVIMFSALTDRGSETTVEALALGASDYLAKPSSLGSGGAPADTRAELLRKVRTLGAGPTPIGGAPPRAASPTQRRKPTVRGPVEVLVIGCSTGGPNALTSVVPALPADLPVPVLIVQHMPPMFTGLLAERLDKSSKLSVKEAVAGARVVPGTVWLAPGGRHMCVDRTPAGVVLSLNEDPPENSCRPAVDPLFRSAVRAYGGKILSLILTGMGQDGLRGCEAIVEAGGQCVAQDEATSVVWGMPGAVATEGLAEKVLPLDEIAPEILKRIDAGRRVQRSPTEVLP